MKFTKKNLVNNFLKASAFLAVLHIIVFYKLDNDKTLEIISAYISMSVGFCITSMSVIATSGFSKALYKIDDPKNNSKSLLHSLLDKFIHVLRVLIITFLLILIYKFFDISNPDPVALVDLFKKEHKLNCFFEINLSFKRFLNSLIWYYSIYSIFIFYRLIILFKYFIIKNTSIIS